MAHFPWSHPPGILDLRSVRLVSVLGRLGWSYLIAALIVIFNFATPGTKSGAELRRLVQRDDVGAEDGDDGDGNSVSSGGTAAST